MQQAQQNGPIPTGAISKSGGNLQLPPSGPQLPAATSALTPAAATPQATGPAAAAVATPTPATVPQAPGQPPAINPSPDPAKPAVNGSTADAAPVTNFQTTHYGYADDKTPDSETKKGNGAFGKLTPGALALTDSMAKSLGANPGDTIELQDAQGNKHQGTYLDRAPQSNNRVDIYDPSGSEKAGAPFNAVSARKVSSTASKLFPKLS